MKTKIFILFTFIVIIWQSTAQTASIFPLNQQNLVNLGNLGNLGNNNIGVSNGQSQSPLTI